MKNYVKSIRIAAMVVMIALAGYFTSVHFSDQEVIKRQLAELAAEIRKEGQEPPVKLALKMHKVKDMIATNYLVTIPERGYSEELGPDLII